MQKQNSKLIRKILLSYAATFVLINLADSLTMVADGIVISRGLGAQALASIGLADPSYKLASLVAGVLSVGLASLCAQAMGSGDRKRTNEIFSAGLAVTLAAAALLTVLCFVFVGRLCRLFGAGDDPELYEHLNRYLRGWFTGMPGYVVFFVLSPLVTLDGNRKNVLAATFLQSLVNIAGDIAGVFWLKLGTYGVGLATGLSFNLSALVLLLNFFRRHTAFRPFAARPDFRALPKTLRIGLPSITLQISRILAPIFINRTIIAVGGSLAMSAVSVKSSILGFTVIVGKGIAESVGLMTQILYSEKDALSLKHTVKTGLWLHLLADSLLSLLLFLFAGSLSGLYFAAGSAEWALAVKAVRCLALSLVLNGCNLILLQYLQGARKMLPVHVLTLFHRMVSLTFFTVLLGRLFGTDGLFAAIPVSEAAVLAGYLLAVLLPKRGEDFWNTVLMIPGNFGYDRENSFSVSISTIEEAVAVSERIEAFCREHGVDARKSYFSARCMEELAANIILNGFTADTKRHHCDIRVMIEEGEVVLRLRDDCPYFNLRERYDSLTEDDIDSGVWIRMVFALASDVSYINIFNTNTVIIKM